MATHALKIFFDGGCRPNPGAMETAVVARGVAYIRGDIGYGDNSEAEWHAAIHALEVAALIGARDFILVGDSALIVAQANGTAPCRREALRVHLATFAALRATFERVRIRQCGRSQNLAGITLAKLRA
jgi:ribonuclease HI